MLRIAIIGMGQRGRATLERLKDIPQAKVCTVCDPVKPTDLGEEVEHIATDWHEVTRQNDLQLIYICTPWDCHVEIAVEAMKQGKHVAIEVPAAMTVSDCELLVRIARWTSRHCVMLENCCYDTWHLGIRQLVQEGRFGRITHLEGAYIHPVEENWMGDLRKHHRGNPYPTHGFGPMCQLLPLGDRLASLVSISNDNDEEGNHINDTIVRTQKGVTMLLQYDTSTPRPYNRLQTVCGTRGFAQKYPLPTIQVEGKLLQGDEATTFVENHIPMELQLLLQEGRERGVKNVMNYIMDRRLIDALICEEESEALSLDMDVHEAALWSSITELTERSASQGGMCITIPDF